MGRRGPEPQKTCRRGHDKDVTGRHSGGACAECCRDNLRRKRAERRELVQAIKLERGCASCGYKEHPAALQFHHLDPQTKSYNIGRAAEYATESKLLQEIEKCVVLCANCHLALHHGTE